MKVSASKKVSKFFNKYKIISYGRGEAIIRASDNPQGISFLVKGYVRHYSINRDGQEFTLNIFKPGSYFPVAWAIAQESNHYFYEAMTFVEIRRAPKKDVLLFFKQNPSVIYELTKRLLSGLSGLLVRMEYLLQGNAKQKVCATLYILSKRFGEKNGGKKIVIRLPITHQGIASLAGLSRETTSLEMKKLERDGIIIKENRYIVVNEPGKLKPKSLSYPKSNYLPHSY